MPEYRIYASNDDPNALQNAGSAAVQRAARICDSTAKVMDALRGLSHFDCNLVYHDARERLALEKPRSNRSPQASQVTAGEKTRLLDLYDPGMKVPVHRARPL
jgi:hypothetical protein